MWILLLCSFVPYENELVDYVDFIEVNHYYNDKAELAFIQVIFWDWEDEYVCVAWRLKKSFVIPCREGFYYTWYDRETVRRKVIAPVYQETHTSYDPERENLKKVPAKKRRGLRKR